MPSFTSLPDDHDEPGAVPNSSLAKTEDVPNASVTEGGPPPGSRVVSFSSQPNDPAHEPFHEPPGTPVFMARNKSLLGVNPPREKEAEMRPGSPRSTSFALTQQQAAAEGREGMVLEPEKKPDEEQPAPPEYPGPDHDEPLQPYERKNIVIGYAFGIFVLTCAIAADEKVSGFSGALSDWAHRQNCGSECVRHPECSDTPDATPIPTAVGGQPPPLEDIYIECPAHLGDWMLWAGTVGAVLFNCVLSYFAGRLHLKDPTFWKVSYTRKISHFTMFMMQIVVRYTVALDSHTTETVSTIVATSTLYMMLYHAVLLKPVRKRFQWARTIFASLDRPADRPYTLRWLTTQNIAYYMVFVPLMYCLIAVDAFELYFIPTLVVGLGDGLAEPVGVTWGKHKYKARAIWYKKQCCAGEFTRSLEGSACVFIASMLAVGVMVTEFSNWSQFGVAMGVIPITMTLAEAFSPHTWDTPFLFGIGGSIIFAITFI